MPTVIFVCPKCGLVYRTTQEWRSPSQFGRFDCRKCKTEIYRWSGAYDYSDWSEVELVRGAVRKMENGMSEKPKFHSRMIKDGRWTVRVITGHGPESHVGDFASEAEADKWIKTKSKDWPSKPDKLE